MGIKHTITAGHESPLAVTAADQDLMTAEIAKRAYEMMLLLRRFDEKCGQLVALGVISETAPMATGRESVPVSIALSRAPCEPCVSATGLHSTLLALGVDPELLFSDVIAGNLSQERKCAEEHVQFCASAPDALAAAATQSPPGAAVFCWIDATSEAETASLAGLSSALRPHRPLVVIANVKSGSDVAVPAAPGLLVAHADSADAGRIRSLCCTAAERARLQGQPSLLLVRTAGFQGHAAAEQQRPGTRQPARETWDPIAALRRRLLDEYGVSEAVLKAMEKAVRDRISSAAAAARACA